MKTIGIIAEFNPFHNGHKYLIHQAKQLTGADNVVVVCSGNFVQRGIPAIYDKYDRARIALLNGADLVIELPVFYSTASAELFALGGVSLLTQLNCIDSLCFGCETDHLHALTFLSEILSEEPQSYSETLRQALANGDSYPKAREKALEQYCSKTGLLDTDTLKEVLSGPNNILALEYLKALKRFNSSIKPVAIKREGSAYHSLSFDEHFASATGIREAISQANFQSIRKFLPENALDSLQNATPIFGANLDLILGQCLLSRNDFTDIFGISEDLSNRIIRERSNYHSFESFAHFLQTKNYTFTAISRALLHICLNIRKNDLDSFINQNYHSYIRVLGFRKSSALLSEIKKKSPLPIIGKLSDFYALSTGIVRLSLNQNIACDHLYRMLQMHSYEGYIPTEFERQIIVL